MKNQILVFVDAGVENYQQLFDGVVAEARPFILHTATDGIQQIDQILQQYPGQKTVHIISHGAPGCLYLGNTQLSLDTLQLYAPQVQQWDIDHLLLYGCHVAAGDAGEEFVSKLQSLTGANIAASKSLTGAAVKGGNWELEVNTGKVKVTTALQTEVMETYSGVFNYQLEVAQKIGNEWGLGIATDSNGNVWATGYFSGSIDIDGDGNNDLISNGYEDSYVVKFDSDGNLLFAQNIGSGADGEIGYGIATDSDGNAWATGRFFGSIDIDGDGNHDLTSNGSLDSYVAKFDSNGNLLFAQNIGGSSSDEGHGIATDSDGNVWATGSFQSSIDIDGDGNNDLTSNGFYDSYVAKFDSNGNLLFAQNVGDRSSDEGHGIATDSNGNVWATGSFKGSIDIDGDGNNDLTSNDRYGRYDSYVAKFDSNGNFLFAQNIGSNSNDHGYDIATDSDGNAWATGSFGGSIDIDGDGNNDLTSNGDGDSYVLKFDSNGNLQFAQNIGGSDGDYGYGIAIDSNGNVWATGDFDGSIDIDGDGSNDLTSNGSLDSYVAKFDNNGNFLFAQNIGGGLSGRGRGIATDSNGNVWATGKFSGSTDIDGDGNNDLTGRGGYIVKFSENTSPSQPVRFDFNGDGIADILWRNSTNGANSIWLMNDDGTRNSSVNPGRVDTAWDVAGVDDFNADGVTDILWRHGTLGNNRIWLMNSDGTRSSIVNPGGVDTALDVAGIDDFNSDGVPDILWRNGTLGNNRIWLMNSDGTRSSIVNPGRVDTTLDVAGVDDFNDDGVADILWRNGTNGNNTIWLMNDNGTRNSIVNPGGVDTALDVAGVDDFNADGVPDILWRNGSNGANSIWLMNDDGTRSSIVNPGRAGTAWDVAGVEDFNADGVADILWRNVSNGTNSIWFMDNDGTRSSIVNPGRAGTAWDVVGV
ncbi:MAG: DUF4347 domain-containing protein [Okeania sp. SIO3B5]|uniref:DUF4347 domain-containing protein n=1 Tax=Okeania sp. SIO3B5 TaxID=2607811 RepID=UPI0013FF0D75|nr:DUF4347 domain-containing protein [Okeania sp. SIO3B5]NEO54934.1 DUF4347 domain-containing protein [Okeania sp. SIO3B5]